MTFGYSPPFPSRLRSASRNLAMIPPVTFPLGLSQKNPWASHRIHFVHHPISTYLPEAVLGVAM
jgi:hypothetical protein